MNLKSPNTLRGKFFDIHLNFETGQSDNAVGIKDSVISRHEASLNHTVEYLDPLKIQKRQQTIARTLATGLEFLVFNFTEIVYITKSGQQQVVELNFSRVSKYINSISQKLRIKDKILDRFEYSLHYFPLINKPFTKDMLNKELVSKMLVDIGFQHDPESVLILTGEMIWSRYLNTFVLLELFKKMHAMQYVFLDGNGIWDRLLKHDEIGDFVYLKKKELMPQILYVEVPENKNKITINGNSEARNVYLINPLNVFNFIAGEYDYQGNMIPEFLIINKKLKQARENKFTQIKEDLYKCFNQSIQVIPQEQQLETKKEIPLLLGDSQDCIKKVGEWVNENETIGTYKLLQNDFYYIPKGYSIKVFHGQLLKKGELIAEHRFKGKITAKNAGKVNTQYLERSLIKMQINEEQHSLITPFSGEVSAKVQKGEIRLSEVILTVFKIDAYIGEGVSAKFTKEVHRDQIVYCDNYSDLMKLLHEDGGIKLHLELKGIIVNYLSWHEYKELLKQAPKGLNLAIISLESPDNPFSNKLLAQSLNEMITMDKEGIGLKVNKHEKKIILNSTKFDHKIVRFIDYEAFILYGKIIKSINESNNDYLIDNQDGFIECNLINFIEIADGK